MSIQSAEDFDPTSSTPVFGSAVSQTKLQQQQQPTNDLGGSEKLVTPPQPVPNGQNESTNEKNGENLENGTASSHHTNGGDASEVHVNGKDHDKPAEEAIPTSTVSDPVEKTSQNESSSTPSTEPVANLSSSNVDSSTTAEPEPALTTSAKEDEPAVTTADTAVAEPETTQTDVPAPKVAVPATPEPKTKVICLFFPIDRSCMCSLFEILVTSRQS